MALFRQRPEPGGFYDGQGNPTTGQGRQHDDIAVLEGGGELVIGSGLSRRRPQRGQQGKRGHREQSSTPCRPRPSALSQYGTHSVSPC